MVIQILMMEVKERARTGETLTSRINRRRMARLGRRSGRRSRRSTPTLQSTRMKWKSCKQLLTYRGIRGIRKGIADVMRNKVVDILLILLILAYTILVVLMLAIDDILNEHKTLLLLFQITELVFLAAFCVEIFLSGLGFGCLYFKDIWNIADMVVIVLTIILTVVDMILDDANASSILRIRGIFRLLRVFMLLRRVSITP